MFLFIYFLFFELGDSKSIRKSSVKVYKWNKLVVFIIILEGKYIFNEIMQFSNSYLITYQCHATVMRPREMCYRCVSIVYKFNRPSSFVFDPYEYNT